MVMKFLPLHIFEEFNLILIKVYVGTIFGESNWPLVREQRHVLIDKMTNCNRKLILSLCLCVSQTYPVLFFR